MAWPVDKLLFPKYGNKSYEDEQDLYRKIESLREQPETPWQVIHLPTTATPCLLFGHLLNRQRVVLYLKGNGEDLLDVFDAAAEFAALFANVNAMVLVPEYPGYGATPGTPSESSVNEVAVEALNYAFGLAGRVIVVGRSIGAGPAVHICKPQYRTGNQEIEALVTLSGWSRLTDVTDNWNPLTNSSWFLSERWDSLAAAPMIDVPWIIFHGQNDCVIPASSAQKLFKAARAGSHTVLTTVRGIFHKDVYGWIYYLFRRLESYLQGNTVPWTPPAAPLNPLSMAYVHGFNDPSDSVEKRCDALQKTVNLYPRVGIIRVHTIVWESVAANTQVSVGSVLPSSFASSAATSGASSYSIDAFLQRQIRIAADGGPIAIVAHSHGCSKVVDWLLRTPSWWGNVTRIAFLHPDVGKHELGPMITTNAKIGAEKSTFVKHMTHELPDLNLLRRRIAVFDTSSDYATTVSGAAFGSRDIGSLCSLHVQKEGVSHSVWLDDGGLRRIVVRWLLYGDIEHDRLPQGVTATHIGH